MLLIHFVKKFYCTQLFPYSEHGRFLSLWLNRIKWNILLNKTDVLLTLLLDITDYNVEALIYK